MNISDLILREPASGLLFSELLLIWSAVHYLICQDEVPETAATGETTKVDFRNNPKWLASVFLRAFVSAAAAAAMTTFRSWALIATVFVATLILPLLRGLLNPEHIPELEIGFNIIFVAVLAVLIDHYRLKLWWSPIRIEVSNPRIIAASLILAIVLFSLRGGTYIVRGVLDKTGSLPKLRFVSDSAQAAPVAAAAAAAPAAVALAAAGADSVRAGIDVKEYSRGRLIGNLERLLLLVVVAAGSYESLAFLAAAKGLIRSKDLENRDWAEYFLVGSLASVLVALAGGLLIQQLLKALW